MSTAVQTGPVARHEPTPSASARVATDGKFLCLRSEARSAEAGARFFVKGVSYGTFAPDSDGYQFPSPPQIAEDFRLMASLGLNTVRTYTVRMDVRW